MRRVKVLFDFFACAMFLCSCGDEITSLHENQGNVVQNVATGASLPACDSINLGDIVFVEDSVALMYCGEKGWSSLKGSDGQNGTDGISGEVHKTVDTVFVNQKDTVFVHVRDTVLKVDSVFGIPGVGCDAESIEGGHKIVCGDDSVGVILDGSLGNNGADGKDGIGSCATTDNLNGTITVSCGIGGNVQSAILYKALCDNSPYDPENKVCVDFGLLPICNDQNVGFVEINTNGTAYTCREKNWSVSSENEINVGKACLVLNRGEMVEGADGQKWVCRADWELASEKEISLGKGCTDINQDESLRLDYSYWVCRADSVGWVYDFNHLYRDSVEYSGKIYKTIGIGSQMWFAENLNYADSIATPNIKGNSWCYNNQESRCDAQGRLYSWTAAMDIPNEYKAKSATEAGVITQQNHRGICPEGWHVPTHDEFVELYIFVDTNNGDEGVGTSLKSPEGWNVLDSVAQGTDRFGFNGKSGNKWMSNSSKFNTDDGTFIDIWENPISDKDSSSRITTWVLSSSKTYTVKENNDLWPHDVFHYKASGMSVRCLKN